MPTFDTTPAPSQQNQPPTSSSIGPTGTANAVAVMAIFGGVLLAVFAAREIWANGGSIWSTCFKVSFRVHELSIRTLASTFGEVVAAMAGMAIGIGGVGLFVDGIMGLKGKRPSMIWADFIGMFGFGLYFILACISILFTLNSVLLEQGGDLFERVTWACSDCLTFFLMLMIPMYFIPLFLARKKA